MSLDSLCEHLAAGGPASRQEAWKRLVTQGNLWPLCRQAAAHPATLPLLEQAYGSLNGGKSLNEARRQISDEDEAAYVNAVLQRTVAAAAVALLARHRTKIDRIDAQLALWTHRAVMLNDPSVNLSTPATDMVHMDGTALIHHCFTGCKQTANPKHWSLARAAALMLADGFKPQHSLPHIPILLVDKTGAPGYVVRLALHALPNGAGQLVRSPQMLRFFSSGWRNAIDGVWKRIAARFPTLDVYWEIGGSADLDRLDGNSAQAAFQAGLTLLADGSLYDRDCAISAKVDDLGGLGHVNGIARADRVAGPKLDAAGVARLRRVIVSKANHEQLSATTLDVLKDNGLEILLAETIEKAIEFVSETAGKLRIYLKRVERAEGPAEERPAYLGPRTLEQLYIQPDVLKRVPGSRMEREPSKEDDRSARASDPRAHLAAEAMDLGELLYGERPEQEQRTSWAAELPQIQRAVVQAPPGQGKSLLTQRTAGSLAAKTLDQLSKQEVGLAGATLPIVIPLKTLAQRGGGSVSTETLREAIRLALDALGHSSEAARYLADHAHERRIWLLLDALDEVEAEHRGNLTALFAALRQPEWQCRVVLTSRPYGYRNELDGADVSHYRLAEFSGDQSREFVRRWFTDSLVNSSGNGASALRERSQERMLRLLDTSVAIQRMSQSPFLLTLLCWLVEREATPVPANAPAQAGRTTAASDPFARLTRTQLYGIAVRNLLGMDPHGDVNVQRGVELRPQIGYIALKSFLENAALHPFAVEWLLTAIKEAQDTEPKVNPTVVLDELIRKRFLVPIDAGRSAYVFPHRSLLEYLAGWKLADLANTQGWAEIAGLADGRSWLPDWEEVIQFLAGSLDNPIPLLEVLSDGGRDDYFRHRLGLAALCLPEIAALQDEAAS
jgi:hypothetical protein